MPALPTLSPLVLVLAIAAPAAPVLAQPVPVDPGGGQIVQLDVLTDRTWIGAGETLYLGVAFRIEPHWHIYWKNAGASGGPTEIEVTAPEGFEVGEIMWPRPAVIPDVAGDTYGYEDRVVLYIPITAPASRDDMPEGPRTEFELRIDWMVCRRACLMGSAERSVSIFTAPPAFNSPPLNSSFARFMELLPQPLDEQAGAVLEFDGTTLRLEGPAPIPGDVAFIPEDCPGVEFGDPAVSTTAGRFTIEIPIDLKPHNALGQPMRLAGLVTIGRDINDPAYSFELPVETDEEPKDIDVR